MDGVITEVGSPPGSAGQVRWPRLRAAWLACLIGWLTLGSNACTAANSGADTSGNRSATSTGLSRAAATSASVLYDVTLGGTRTISTTYMLPTLPKYVTKTVQANPRNYKRLLAANPTNTRFELADGNYGYWRRVADDVRLADLQFVAVSPGGVTFSDIIIANADRILFSGLNHTGKMAIENFGGMDAPSDILIDNHYGYMGPFAAEASIVPQGGYERVMIQNSTFLNDNGGQFGLIGGNENLPNNGFISANNWWYQRATTSGPTIVRLMSCDNVLFVDDYFQDTRFRMHKSINQVTIADVIGVSSGGGFYFITDRIDSEVGAVQSLRIERTSIYDAVSDFPDENLWTAMVGVGGNALRPAHAIDNRFYYHLQLSGSDDMVPNVNRRGFAAGAYSNNLRVPFQSPPGRTTEGATGAGRP